MEEALLRGSKENWYERLRNSMVYWFVGGALEWNAVPLLGLACVRGRVPWFSLSGCAASCRCILNSGRAEPTIVMGIGGRPVDLLDIPRVVG